MLFVSVFASEISHCLYQNTRLKQNRRRNTPSHNSRDENESKADSTLPLYFFSFIADSSILGGMFLFSRCSHICWHTNFLLLGSKKNAAMAVPTNTWKWIALERKSWGGEDLWFWAFLVILQEQENSLYTISSMQLLYCQSKHMCNTWDMMLIHSFPFLSLLP